MELVEAEPLKALSLFSGAGGMDIGVRQAGFEVVGQIELDEHCCSTLTEANRREGTATAVINADIRSLQPSDLLQRFGLKSEELDLLCGGPPCQSFSLAGKQLGLADSRGPLLFEMARFAATLRPKVILIEQVKGLLSSKGADGTRGGVFKMFLESLREIGYTPTWQVVNAADFGVPQLRQRLFVVATRELDHFSFPQPTHGPESEPNDLFGLKPYVGVGQVIDDLPPPELKVPRQTLFTRTDSHIDVTPSRDRERIAVVPEGSYLAAQTHVSADLRRGLKSKDTTKYLRVHRKRPSNTLRCGEIFYHPTENRYLTPREYMRIHGYPDHYLLSGPIRARTGTVRNLDQHRQVANSVPPPIAKVLSLAIARSLNSNDQRNSQWPHNASAYDQSASPVTA